LVLRAVNADFKRLDPHKADLQRWRESFAHELRLRGVEARATKRVTRGMTRAGQPRWSLEAKEQGRLLSDRGDLLASGQKTMLRALTAWKRVYDALASSTNPADQQLARDVKTYLARTSLAQELTAQHLARQPTEHRLVQQQPKRKAGRSR
jgi:hypothetical protein